MRMNKPAKKSLVSKLRFPEFREAGEWEAESLETVAAFVNEKITVELVALENYVSTENILPDYGGIDKASKLPTTGSVTWFKLNDTLFSNIRPYLKKVWTSDKEGGASNDVIVIRAEQRLLPQYLSGLLKNDTFINYVMSGAKGVKMPRGDIGSIRAYPVPYPSKSEQQKIADCLSSLDDLISAQAQKIDALKTHKKGLMQQLFPAEGETVPKLRFPEFSWDWIPYKIGDFIESYCGGAALTPSDFSLTPDYEVIPKKAITEGGWLRIDSQNPTYCNEVFYKNNLQSVVDSTYLITTLRDLVPSGPSIGYIVKYKKNKKYLLAQGVYGFKTKQDIFSDFLIHFSNSNVYRKMMQSVMVGSTQVHIRTSIFFDIPIFIPTLKEQQKVADCLSSLDDLITAHTQKLDALKNLKKGLMQQLFPAIDEVSA